MEPASTYPTDPKLTPLLRERQFQGACIIGLPGLLYAYVEAFRAIVLGEPFNADGVALALSANPITLYLLARQYPRGKAAEAIGVQLAPLPGPVDPGATVEVTAQDQAEASVEVHTGQESAGVRILPSPEEIAAGEPEGD